MPISSISFIGGQINNSIIKYPNPTITSAIFQQVSVRGQITITNITGIFDYYEINQNDIYYGQNNNSTCTITGLADNYNAKYTITPIKNFKRGIPYTVTGGIQGNGYIYTMAYISNITFTNIGVTIATLNYSGSYTGNLTITYSGGSASPASGFTTTLTTYNMTSMSANTTYNFSINCINGDGIAGNTGIGSILTAFYAATGTYTSRSFNGYTTLKYTSNGGITFYNVNVNCQVLLVAGGGGGGSHISTNGAGGGGAGGVGYGNITFSNSTTYSITIGGGGSSSVNTRGGTGGPSTIIGGTINETANGGGGGGGYNNGTASYAGGVPGGCGGGAGYSNAALRGGGVASLGSGSLSYFGRDGGSNGYPAGTGGGGGGGAGGTGFQASGNAAGAGGSGITWTLGGTTYGTYGGGGGAGGGTAASGGSGIGGTGTTNANGNPGTTNTGSGGGGCGSGKTSGAGGSGVCVIAFK